MTQALADAYRRFAAARCAGAPVGAYAEFRDWLLHHWPTVVPVIMARSTQTNEAARYVVDLNPIDVSDREQLAWLKTLVWPEHTQRRVRLHRAAALVASSHGQSFERL